MPFDIHRDDCQILFIDVQERFLSAIPSLAEEESTGKACRLLAQGAQVLGVPMVLSEQYPQGLGHTLPYLRELTRGSPVLAKTHFSCFGDEALRTQLASAGRRYLIIAGIEAHVCVLGTVADAQRHGYQVLLAGDAVASRHAQHARWALDAARDLGALVVPVESLLFRLQGAAGGEQFKALSRLVR